MLTATWDNSIPDDQEVIFQSAGRLRNVKRDFRERIDSYVPIGLILEWPTETVPDGFAECDGSSMSVVTYPRLFDEIGYTFGGSGLSFNLPDMRGLFARCLKDGATGRDLDSDETTFVGNVSGAAITSITGLTAVPRIGSIITGTGVLADTKITAYPTRDSDGIPTEITLSQACSAGTSITFTINGDVIGSTQEDENKRHAHEHLGCADPVTLINAQSYADTGLSGGEARPKNVNIMFIIRTDTL